MITRYIDTYRASLLSVVNNEPTVVATVDFYSTKGGRRCEAIAEFKEHGIAVPRGKDIIIEKVSTNKYYCSYSEFIEFAHKKED